MRIRICIHLLVAFMLVMAGPRSAFAQDSAPTTNPVVHVEVLGSDAPRLQRFYAELFGWKIALNPVGYGYVPVAPAAPAKLTGAIGPSPQSQPLVIFYVKVEDPASILRRAEALGGRIVMPPVEVPGGITFARFADPEGNVIGVVRRQN